MRSVIAVLILAASTARAQPSLTPPIQPPEVEHTSYAAQTLTVDGISIAALIGGAMAEGAHGRDTDTSNTLFTIGGIGALFASPIVHLVHGHGGRSVTSLLVRFGGMSVGMGIGVAMTSCPNPDSLCKLNGLGPGALGGLIVASIIDAATMTDETVEKPARWAPVLAPTPGGGTVGFAAAF